MKTIALELAKQGMSKQLLLAALTQQFTLSEKTILAADVTNYYIKYWGGRYLAQNIVEGTIPIYPDDIAYAIIFRCRPSDAFKAKQVALSFRASALGNFVLVSIPPHPVYKVEG